MNKQIKFSLKILCLALIFVVAFGFCACSNVNATTIANEDGSIDELVTITLDKQKFADAGYTNYYDVQAYISDNANLVVKYLIEQFNKKVALDIKNYANWNKLSQTKNTGVWEGDTFKIGLHYQDLRAYKFCYGITEEISSEPVVEKHFLYTKYITKGFTMYASYNWLYQQLYQEFSDYFSENCPELLNEKCELTYTHRLTYRRQKSDADYVQKIDGKYYHTWKLKEGETNKVITIYYNLANRSNCILVCILASLALCTVLLLIGFVITKVKNKKNKNN